MTDLDEKALEAAIDAVSHHKPMMVNPSYLSMGAIAVSAITAYLSHLPAQAEGVRVKGLEWKQNWSNDPLSAFASADRIDRVYTVDHNRPRFYVSTGISPHNSLDDALGNFGSLDEAKAAAQGDYDARIRSALEPASSEAIVRAQRSEWPDRQSGDPSPPVAGEPVAWTTLGNLAVLKNTPHEAAAMWGQPNGSIRVPLYRASPVEADAAQPTPTMERK